MQNYQMVPVTKLRPDPDQPRRYFDKEELEGMAVSLKNEGVINAVEVDEDYVIVTGERRWRASKMAGLKEIPVKIMKGLTAEARFIRQVQENIHSNTMSVLDLAHAFVKIRGFLVSRSESKPKTTKRGGTHSGEEGVGEISKLFGLSAGKVSETLALLKEEGKIKAGLQTGKIAPTKIRYANKVQSKYQKDLKDLIVEQPEMKAETVRHLADAINRGVKYGEKEKVEEMLKEDFNDKPLFEAIRKISKFVPSEDQRTKEPAEALKDISVKIGDLMEMLEKHPPKSFDGFHGPLLMNDIKRLIGFLFRYLGLKKSDIPQLPQLTEGKD